jgi:hypothetical protein
MLPPIAGSQSLTAKTAADGDLIAEFGDAGILRTTVPAAGYMDLQPYGFAAEAIVPELGASDDRRLLIQPDGAISNTAAITVVKVPHLNGYLIADTSPNGPPNLIQRFHANGEPDLDFAAALSTSVSTISDFYGFRDDLAIYPDGRIAAEFLQAANSISYTACVMRLHPDGRFDTTFNGTGWICVSSPNKAAGVGILRIHDQDSLLVTSASANQYWTEYAALRVLESGAVIPLPEPALCGSSANKTNSFTKGIGRFAEGPSGEIYAYWFQMLSRVTVLCRGWTRFQADWTIDTTFGLTGTNFTLGPNIAFSKNLSQTIYAAHTITDSLGADVFNRIQVSRYGHDGQTLDPTFGVSGSITLSLGTPGLTPPESSDVLALTSTFDGSLYVGGWYRNRAQGKDYLTFARVRGNTVDLHRYWLPIAAR